MTTLFKISKLIALNSMSFATDAFEFNFFFFVRFLRLYDNTYAFVYCPMSTRKYLSIFDISPAWFAVVYFGKERKNKEREKLFLFVVSFRLSVECHNWNGWYAVGTNVSCMYDGIVSCNDATLAVNHRWIRYRRRFVDFNNVHVVHRVRGMCGGSSSFSLFTTHSKIEFLMF